MPKWLSSTLIAIGFIALVLLAVLPRTVDVDVTVTSNNVVKSETTHMTVNHNGAEHNAPVQTAAPQDGAEQEPER